MRLNIEIPDNEVDRFKEVANKILSKCFIMKRIQKDKEIYFYIKKNIVKFQNYFSLLDYEIKYDDNSEIIYLVGRNTEARLKLRMYPSIILLILRLLYIEKKNELSEYSDILCTVIDIHDKYNALNNKKKPNLDKMTLQESLAIFKKYNLINILDKDITQDDCRIELYPSIYFGISNNEINNCVEIVSEKLKKYVSGEEVENENIDED